MGQELDCIEGPPYKRYILKKFGTTHSTDNKNYVDFSATLTKVNQKGNYSNNLFNFYFVIFG